MNAQLREALAALTNEAKRANKTALREFGVGLIDVNVIARADAVLSAPAEQAPATIDVDALTEKIADMLHGTWHCTRVWEAWRVGTMGADDFEPVPESDTPREIAEEILRLRAAAPSAPTAVQPAETQENMDRRGMASMSMPVQPAAQVQEAGGVGAGVPLDSEFSVAFNDALDAAWNDTAGVHVVGKTRHVALSVWRAARAAQPATPVAPTATEMRPHFEWWYTTRGIFPPLGSRECAAAWSAWLASGGYTAPDDWQVSPLPWDWASAVAAAPVAPKTLEALTEEQIARLLRAAIDLPTIYESAAFKKGVRFAERHHGIATKNGMTLGGGE